MKHRYIDILEKIGNDNKTSFDDLHKQWWEAFSLFLKSNGFNKKSIKQLFYYFEMENWKALHLEYTEYKDYTKEQLLKAFLGECHYISDRMSFDRLFRTHWLFLQVFHEEMSKYKYPEIYKNKEPLTERAAK